MNEVSLTRKGRDSKSHPLVLAVAPPVEALTRFIEAELPRLEALNEPDDSAGEVEEPNGFFRRYALAA